MISADQTASRATFSYPDCTVGTGITPAPAGRAVAARSRAFTAGRELRRHAPALTLPRRSIYSVGQLEEYYTSTLGTSAATHGM